jgi:hypothetical protein
MRIDELLKPLGFIRQKMTWNRRAGSFVDVIDLQAGKTGDTVTINAGVLHPEIHMKCWGTEPPQVIEEPSCAVRTRAGQLIEGKDMWWRLEEQESINHIVDALAAYVLPFLERMHSFEAMEQFLTNAGVTKQKYPLPIIYLAILKSERGDCVGACTLLTDLRKKTFGAWQARINAVVEKLGCF